MADSPDSSPYRVLARKYRPRTFAELIGQQAMVTTLGNAIRRDRLAHAFLLTGVRGVGKTSTARLIAKALNCVGLDGAGGPTIDPCGVCDPCVAIAEGRHIDVVEMDAASHTGVDDMREIIEAVRYAAVSARYKIYIIDEVHMLSRNAFNALLKTLEEPPAHVKFLFATTELHKVPVTVLSRCQRFDLRRIPGELLAQHFARVAAAEGVEADGEALSLIARAAEGSARDGLSILDQAIAHGSGSVTAPLVREMLGLSDRGAVRRMFGLLLAGDAGGALAALDDQYALGVDPASLLRGLLETCHGVTRAKVGGVGDTALSAEEREAVEDWASRLGFATLHRLWQLLLKGHGEVQVAVLPREAAEMALLRIIHASQLPDPGELARRIAAGDVAISGGAAPPVPSGEGQDAQRLSLSAEASPAHMSRPAFRTAARDEAGPSDAHASVPPWEQMPEALPSARDISPAGTRAAPSPLPRMPADFTALVAMVEGAGEALMALRLHDNARVIRFAPPQLTLVPHADFDAAFHKKLAALLKDATGQAWTILFEIGQAEPTLLEREKAAAVAERDAVLAMPVVQAAFAAFPEAELLDYSGAQRS